MDTATDTAALGAVAKAQELCNAWTAVIDADGHREELEATYNAAEAAALEVEDLMKDLPYSGESAAWAAYDESTFRECLWG